LIRSERNSKTARSKLPNQVKEIFYLREHVETQEESWWLLWPYLEISSTFEKSFSIARNDQKAKNDSTRAFAAEQLKNLEAFDFFIFDNRHYVFRFAFALIFFKIFLFRSNRVMTIVSRASSSAILTERSSLFWSREDQDMVGDVLAFGTKIFKKRNSVTSLARNSVIY